MDPTLSTAGVALAGTGTVIALVQLLKRYLPTNDAPILALVLGIVWTVITSGLPVDQVHIAAIIAQGVSVGLAAAGAYSAANHYLTPDAPSAPTGPPAKAA